MANARDIDIYTLICHIQAAAHADAFRQDADPSMLDWEKESITSQQESAERYEAQFSTVNTTQWLIKSVLALQGRDDDTLVRQYTETIGAIDQRFIANRAAPAHITPIDAGDLAGVTVVRKGGNISVYFRPTDNWQEMGSNFDTAFEPADRGGYVHRGFHNTLNYPTRDPTQSPPEGVWDQLSEQKQSFFAVTDAVLKREIMAAQQEGHEVQVTVGGVSRGGALAQLAAERWMQDETVPLKTVFAVGSPKVGSAEWVRGYEAMAHQKGVMLLRVESGKDIVSELPPPWLGYEAAGTLIYSPAHYRQGTLIVNPSQAFIDQDKAAFEKEIAAQDKNPLLYKIDYHESMMMRTDLLAVLNAIRTDENKRDKTVNQLAQAPDSELRSALQKMLELYANGSDKFVDGNAVPPETHLAEKPAPENVADTSLGALAAPNVPSSQNSANAGWNINR